MIYNFNLGIGWASSGVEYAQSYRAKVLRKIGKEARFIFTDMFPGENIEHMTKNIGFLDKEVIWLYSFFTDFDTEPVSYTADRLKETFPSQDFTEKRDGKTIRYYFAGTNNFYTAYLCDEKKDFVHRVEMVENGCLIRKDYFTSERLYSEYYAPLDGSAHLYQRRYFNRDGSVAYEEINDDDVVMYKFPDKLLCTKEDLVGYMVQRLNLTSEDTVIIDRTTGVGQAILENAAPARVGIVIHADHFSESSTDEDNILWNNYYEYVFAQNKHIDFYVTATDAQNKLVTEQFEKYLSVTPKVYTIPVGSLEKLHYPTGKRAPHSLITASRLASEKHVDWLVAAVVKAKKNIPDLSLDIYGRGKEEEELKKQISEKKAGSYIRLMGQHDLTEVYQGYEAYLSGSTSEGFGLTLLEAVGGGLPIIGFDVRYGNPTFIDDEENGYLIPVNDHMETKERVKELADRIVRLFGEADLEKFHEHSYDIAARYLTEKIEEKWREALR